MIHPRPVRTRTPRYAWRRRLRRAQYIAACYLCEWSCDLVSLPRAQRRRPVVRWLRDVLWSAGQRLGARACADMPGGDSNMYIVWWYR